VHLLFWSTLFHCDVCESFNMRLLLASSSGAVPRGKLSLCAPQHLALMLTFPSQSCTMQHYGVCTQVLCPWEATTIDVSLKSSRDVGHVTVGSWDVLCLHEVAFLAWCASSHCDALLSHALALWIIIVHALVLCSSAQRSVLMSVHRRQQRLVLRLFLLRMGYVHIAIVLYNT